MPEQGQKMQNTIFIGLLLLAAPALIASAQSSDTPKLHVGTVDITADKAVGSSTVLHLMGHAKITSADYDLYANDIRADSAPGGKTAASGLQKAVAEGGAAPNTQVVAHVRQTLQGIEYEINADRAVYLPDVSRPSGGMLKFTGHVKVITKSGFLAVPSLTTTDTFTILIGAGSDYPQIETGPTHITLTPAQ